MSARPILLQTAGVRIAYGLVSLLAPRLVFAAARMGDPEPDARYANALFGGRDLTVAATTISLLNAGREREALWVNASCEATDLAALLFEARRRRAVEPTLVLGVIFNALGWLSVARAARRLAPPPSG